MFFLWEEGALGMMDRESVVNRIETICNICKENTWCTEFSSDTIYPLLHDALALLKEQQELVRCMDCEHGEKVNSVFLCGKTRGFGIAHDGNWFCADGERREIENDSEG